jgi:urease accessory protein
VLASHGELPLILQRPVRGPLGQAVVTLLTPAGALFDSDVVELDVDCEAGSDVTLTTAAATKLNRCDGDAIRVTLRVRVADGATFRYLPHEVIPFAGTRYLQRIEVETATGGTATLMEVIGPGPSDAPFAYAGLGFSTMLHVGGALAVRERYLLSPHTARQFGDWTHYGSLLTVGAPLDAPIECDQRVQSGESALPCGGRVVKALGDSSQSIRTALLARLRAGAWLDALLPP